MQAMNKLNGLVLSGGLSSRMGRDKGLLVLNDKSWFEIAAGKIQPLCEEIFLSIRKDQEHSYKPFMSDMPDLKIIFDREDLEISGPAKGLISAHLFDPSRDWMVLSTDMLKITSEILSRLKDAWIKNSSYDACLFNPSGLYEPLCGIYTSAGLKKLMEKILFTQNYSLNVHIKILDIFQINSGNIPGESFYSFNSADDLKKIS